MGELYLRTLPSTCGSRLVGVYVTFVIKRWFFIGIIIANIHTCVFIYFFLIYIYISYRQGRDGKNNTCKKCRNIKKIMKYFVDIIKNEVNKK